MRGQLGEFGLPDFFGGLRLRQLALGGGIGLGAGGELFRLDGLQLGDLLLFGGLGFRGGPGLFLGLRGCRELGLFIGLRLGQRLLPGLFLGGQFFLGACSAALASASAALAALEENR